MVMIDSSARSSFATKAVSGLPSPVKILRWAYLYRLLVALVVFFAAAVYHRVVPPTVILVLSVAAIMSVVISVLSFWYTEIKGRYPDLTFRYYQTLFDLGLVTVVVHVTGGADSDFSSLYIVVIAVSAVIMPLPSGLLVTLLAALLYIADIIWGHPFQLSGVVFLQVAVFLAVAVATGWLASRVRLVGEEREVLQREVQRIRLEASDILDSISSGIVTIDAERQLVFANPAAETLLGFRADEYLGRPFQDLLRDRSPDLLRVILDTLEKDRGVQSNEGWAQRDGTDFPIGVTTTCFTPEEGGKSVTAIFTDISERKKLDQLNLRNERLEAVAELSSSLAHEIKNPLASIRSSVEQLSRIAQSGWDEHRLAELVIRESDRLSRLLSDFLNFSRVRVTDRRPIDLEPLIEGAVSMVRKHPDCGSEAQIRLSLPAEGTKIEGDEDLLYQVVFNLVLNAVQATSDGEAVTVELKKASPGELPSEVSIGSPVLLQISDRGGGIPPDILDRIFEPFVTGRADGSGLGLAVVQRAVEAHGGLVFAEPRPEGGTVFSVFLPTLSKVEALV